MAKQTNQALVEQPKHTRLLDLPPEVLHDILLWLPVKTLCRFKCVSNTWRSLISQPNFINSHFNKAFEHQHVFHQRQRALIRDSHLSRLHSLKLDEFLTHTNDVGIDNVVVIVPSTHLNRRRFDKSVLYANGLLLLKSYFVFYLLNPATKEHKRVPGPPQMFKSFLFLYGFGFDVNTQDHKVVWGKFSKFDLGFCVYSLKTGSWRRTEKRYRYESIQSGMQGRVLNGVIHWLVFGYCKTMPSVALLCFGLADEEVQELPLPSELLGKDVEHCFLDIFQECLCVGKTGDFEFWVMKEYGVVESWTKISIPVPFGQGVLSGFVKDNHHLLLDQPRNRLVMYNFEDGSSWNLSVGSSYKVDFVGCYLESLVSPDHYHIADGDH